MAAPLSKKVGYLLSSSTDECVRGLSRFITRVVLGRGIDEVGWFKITHQPGLCHFEIVFHGDPPQACLDGFMFQRDDGTWEVYQWNHYRQERFCLLT